MGYEYGRMLMLRQPRFCFVSREQTFKNEHRLDVGQPGNLSLAVNRNVIHRMHLREKRKKTLKVVPPYLYILSQALGLNALI